MPVVYLSCFLLVGTYLNVIVMGGLIDFTYFDTVNLLTLIIGQTALSINLSLFALTGPVWYVVYAAQDWVTSIVIFLIIHYVFLGDFTYTMITNFVGDTWKVAHFDFSPAYTEGVINYAIATDLLYSFWFFLPALAIVLIQRWPFGQRTFLNVIEWFPKHPKGPIYAISRMFLGLASTVGKIWRGE